METPLTALECNLTVQALGQAPFKELKPTDPCPKCKFLVMDHEDQAVKGERTSTKRPKEGDQESAPKRTKQEAFKFTVTFPEGAKCLNLRKALYEKAQECFAFDGNVEYSKVHGKIVNESDLVATMYFEEKRDALAMQNYCDTAEQLWSMEKPPIVAIKQVPHECQKRVRGKDYDKTISPIRDGWKTCDRPDSGSPSHGTTVIDAETIEQESIVDMSKVRLQFHGAHIEATLKRTARDSKNNVLPLPSDWHGLFDDNNVEGCPVISIAPSGIPSTSTKGKSGREGIYLDVFFAFPNDAKKYAPDLKEGVQRARPQVYRVHIHKLDVKEFAKHLLKRHNEVMKSWASKGWGIPS